ncbi:MAG: hypothetical protein M3Q97_04795 [Bacteroidota bacterium]|nr:hypothetical protein [Bacteroidota bacterium]
MRFSVWICIILMFALSTAVGGQDGVRQLGIPISLKAGISSFNVKNINPLLESQGFPLVDGTVFMTEICFFMGQSGMQENALAYIQLGVAKNGFSSQEANPGTNYSYFTWTTGLNIVLIKKEMSRFYGGTGFGWSDYTIDLRKSDAFPASFPEALVFATQNKRLTSNFNFFVPLTLGYDRVLSQNKSLVLGINGGYRLGIVSRTWEISNQAFDNAPSTSGSGFFGGISLIF